MGQKAQPYSMPCATMSVRGGDAASSLNVQPEMLFDHSCLVIINREGLGGLGRLGFGCTPSDLGCGALKLSGLAALRLF